MQMIDILLKNILWYDFLNDLDAQSDFDKKKIVTVKPVMMLQSTQISYCSSLKFEMCPMPQGSFKIHLVVTLFWVPTLLEDGHYERYRTRAIISTFLKISMSRKFFNISI